MLFLITICANLSCARSTFSAMEFSGGARRGAGPRHRRLVRPRTSPDGARGLGSTRPSPPPFPRRRHVASAGWNRGAEDGPRHATGSVYDSSRHDLLYNTFEAARGLDCLASEGDQGWGAQTEGVKATTECSNGVAAEGLPSRCQSKLGVEPPPSSRRGGSRLTRPTTRVVWRGGHTRNLGGGRPAHRQPPKRPRWDARFWVRAREVSAVRLGE